MKKLDIEFAFEGFRLLRQRPWVVLLWGTVFLVANIIGFGSFVPLLLPMIEQLSSGPPDPAMMPGLISRMILPYLILIVVITLGSVIVSCAIYRTVVHGDKGPFGSLRLGGDELRMIAVHLLFGFIFMGLYAVCLLIGGLTGGLLTAAIGTTNQDLAWLGLIPGIVIIIALLVWLMLRLSLFSVQSFDEKRINLFGSWKLTKGNTWPLLGGYLLAFLLAIVVETVAMVFLWIIAAIVMVANFGALQQLSETSATPEFMTIMTAMAPMMITYIGLFSLLVQPLITAIIVAAPAAAYRSLSGRHPQTVEKIF